jgi:hypothetical protein
MRSLVGFFEATAEFGCAVLLSLMRADPELIAEGRASIGRAAGEGRRLFDRCDFGLWINLGRTLAKAVRSLGNNAAKALRLAEVTQPAAELVQRLAEKDLWTVLDRARQIRNQEAHSGVISRSQTTAWLMTLRDLLSEVERALGTGFDDVDLVRPDAAHFRAGIYVYDHAQRLRGPSGAFEQFELRTRVPAESDRVAFVSRDLEISPVLRLAPLLRVGPPGSSARNACYFVSLHVAGDEYTYVSYHFEDQPRINASDPELEELSRQLDENARP